MKVYYKYYRFIVLINYTFKYAILVTVCEPHIFCISCKITVK